MRLSPLSLRPATVSRYRSDIADVSESGGTGKAAHLLLKAIRGLSEEEQDVALAPLVERGIARQTEARAAGSARVPPSIQVGHMLLAGRSVEDAARLEGVPEHVIEATLRDLAARPGAEPALVSLLSLVAEGRSPTQARRELDLSKDDFTGSGAAPWVREARMKASSSIKGVP